MFWYWEYYYYWHIFCKRHLLKSIPNHIGLECAFVRILINENMENVRVQLGSGRNQYGCQAHVQKMVDKVRSDDVALQWSYIYIQTHMYRLMREPATTAVYDRMSTWSVHVGFYTPQQWRATTNQRAPTALLWRGCLPSMAVEDKGQHDNKTTKQNGCQQADRPTKMTGWIIWTAGWQNKLMNMKYIYKWMFSSWWPSHSSPLRMITPGSLSATVCSTNLPHQQSSTMLQPKTAVFSSNKDDTFQNEHDFMSSLGSPQPQHVGRDPSLIGNRRIQDWRTPAQHTRINSNWWHHWAVNLTLISFHIVDDTVSATGNTWADTKDINKPKTSAPSNLWSTTHLHLNKQQVFWQTCLNQSTLKVTTTNCSRTSAILLSNFNFNTRQR